MISHNRPINTFIFAFNFLERKERSKDHVTGAGQADPVLSEPLRLLPWPHPPPGPTPPSPITGWGFEPVSHQLPSRGRMFLDSTLISLMVTTPGTAWLCVPEQLGLGFPGKEAFLCITAHPTLLPRASSSCWLCFLYVGGELGAVERTRILHSLRGAEDPPSWLQWGARPGPEEEGTRREFKSILVIHLCIHRTRQDQPGGGAA